MSNNKDYYQLLGLNKNSTPEEIKQAYRKLAREYHPDMVKEGDKANSEKKFKEVNEAYQVLSDPEKRKVYDQYCSSAFGPGGFGGAGGQGARGSAGGQWGPFSYTYTAGGNPNDFGFGDFDPFDVFEQFFGGRGGGRAAKKGKSLHYEMVIDFTDAIFGLEKEISAESGKVKIKIPAGVRDGTELRFAEKGMPGPDNLPPGDLHLTVRVKVPNYFEVYGDHLIVRKEIDFVDAILGTEIEVPVVDTRQKNGIGNTKLKIPAGTQHASKFLVRGKGMPKLQGRGQGDVLVEVYVNVPAKVSRKQRELLEEYKKA